MMQFNHSRIRHNPAAGSVCTERPRRQPALGRWTGTANANKSGERGFSLILIGLLLFVMIGMVGLAIDLGRIFVYKSELQTFADNSAMAAIAKMDGTQSGIQSANAIALTGPDGATLANKVNFDSTTISTVTPTYATSFSGTYDSYATASTPATNSYRFVKVLASANVSLSFLPVLPNIATAYTVSATAASSRSLHSPTAVCCRSHRTRITKPT